MRNIKDFQARYDRWKNGERYWDIRGIDLPRYDTGDKNTVITDDGSVFNVDPSAIGARNLEVTTPEVEVIGKKQYPYQSAFNPYALTEGIQYALGNTVGKVMEPVSKIPGVMPVLRTLTPSNWIGTLRTGIPMWDEKNPGFGDSYGDKQLNLLFDLGASKVPISGAGRVISKAPYSQVYRILNDTGRDALNSALQWQAKHPILNRTILPPNQAGHFYRVGSSPMIDDAVNTGIIRSRTGWYHGALDRAIERHPQLLKYFTRDELSNMNPADLEQALEDLGLDWNSFGRTERTSKSGINLGYRPSTNHGGTVGFVKDGYFYNLTNNDYIIDGTNASRFAKGHHGSYDPKAPMYKGTPVVLIENGSPKHASAPASEFNYWEKNGHFWRRRDFNTQRTGYVQPGITFDQARDYNQLLKFVDSRTKSLQPL